MLDPTILTTESTNDLDDNVMQKIKVNHDVIVRN